MPKMKESHCRRRHWPQALTFGQVRDCQDDAHNYPFFLSSSGWRPSVPASTGVDVERCLLLSFELFVRVAQKRVLRLATIETLLIRQLLDMDDIRSWLTTAAMRRRRWLAVGHRCTPRSRNAALADINDLAKRFASFAPSMAVVN
jgi:hypothetical protein